MNAFMREFIKAAREAPRLFFLPLTAAIEAVRREMGHRRYDRHPDKPDSPKSHTDAQDQR
ncbi:MULTISPECIES: hypothetical protein [unclassified Paraburkholderia]|uniref:hypothetical protein n=1 Tax=unclassified Paraburkholderia TaxID=2615204 RepID=UPI00161EF63E|nr:MULTISPECIES: hypothetical protein [unclassified Paraburkholderia]MBB5441430.1 hypothetical protein [Paraburkholderia sp. WSM4177]MBB5481825.1 hypothetical protein [Paraburkholderia sp. WSM4180]